MMAEQALQRLDAEVSLPVPKLASADAANGTSASGGNP
jgi:hypothetical protein